MTIPKNAGHYPVKKKHQPRRLDPNWDGIIWLEYRSEAHVEVRWTYPMMSDEGFTVQRAQGWVRASEGRNFPRPMFQVFADGASGTLPLSRRPCEACDDFSRSWACEEHPEVSWDAKRRVWVRPGTPAWYELHPEDRPPGASSRSGARYYHSPVPAAVRIDRVPLGATVTLTDTFTLEIIGDTSASTRVRIEVERDGDTTP